MIVASKTAAEAAIKEALLEENRPTKEPPGVLTKVRGRQIMGTHIAVGSIGPAGTRAPSEWIYPLFWYVTKVTN
jgi:hypothetical protein